MQTFEFFVTEQCNDCSIGQLCSLQVQRQLWEGEQCSSWRAMVGSH